MANKKHLEIIKQGVEVWNEWRRKNSDERPDLSNADLSGAFLSGAEFQDTDLREVNLSRADLSKAIFIWANLYKANLTGANLRGAELWGAHLREANLWKADLTDADLRQANLVEANLREAKLYISNLDGTNLNKANLERTNLAASRIYGISAWDVKLNKTEQRDLIITPEGAPIITVDNLEIAQFIYLLLHNEKIRHVIEMITSKVVLILGRFTPERKPILNAIKNELRYRNFLPILFDFSIPASRDITETLSLLARMSRFVIADITDARSIPQELMEIVPHLPSVPVQPLLEQKKDEYGMFEHFKRYPWVLAVYHYKDLDDLMKNLSEKVIAPVEAKIKEVSKK